MKSQVEKRININLTQKEINALENLKDEWTTRNRNYIMSDVIREAINFYAEKMTGQHNG